MTTFEGTVFLVISLCFLCFTIIIVLKSKTKAIKRGERQLKSIINTITYLALLTGAFSVLLSTYTFIYSIHKAKFEVSFIDGHYLKWGEEGQGDTLILASDNEGYVGYQFSVPMWWNIQISNVGNKAAQTYKVKIKFNGIYLYREPNDYTVGDHLYGHGGWLTLEREIDSPLNPGDIYQLPDLPVDMLVCKDDVNDDIDFPYNATMEIMIFEDSIEIFKKEYIIEVQKYDDGFDDKITLRNKDYMYTVEGENESIDFYSKKYATALSKINVYNQNIVSENKLLALDYGRKYYRIKSDLELLNYSVVDIESLIQNDFKAYS